MSTERACASQALRPAPELDTQTLQTGDRQWRVIRDLVTGLSIYEIVNEQGVLWIGDTGAVVRRLEHEGWRTEVVTRTVLTSTDHDFHNFAHLDAHEHLVRL